MNVSAVVNEVLRRLGGQYRIVGSLVAGSAVTDPQNALDVDMCVVVHDNVLRQAKLFVLDTHVDLFVCGMQRLRWEFGKGQHLYLVPLFATGTCWSGERGSIENLQALARSLFEGPVPLAPSRAYAVRHRCYSMLRKFDRACRQGDPSAGLMAATLIPMAIEAYFEVNRMWAAGVRHRLSTLRARDAGAAEAVERVLAEPLNGLINKPALLREMLIALIGDKPVAEETWID